MTDEQQQGRRPGKTGYALRRRPVTRSSGFSSHPDATGAEYKRITCPTTRFYAGERVEIAFSLPDATEDDWVGFGVWYWCNGPADIHVSGGPKKYHSKQFPSPDWSKIGSLWRGASGNVRTVVLTITPQTDVEIGLYEPRCGIIRHKFLSSARTQLLGNMHIFSPEAIFLDTPGEVATTLDNAVADSATDPAVLYLKSCNRCARFLPVNVHDERNHLSFSNHCRAFHRIPCRHPGFGLLREETTGEPLKLTYGFQLECRFCKKFTVNAAHNPQRTTGQMKEDAARRRAFEVLVSELYQGSPKQRYRAQTGRDLAEDVYERFDGRCFNCGQRLPNDNSWHLDHTRPLALLWPLDQYATALCADCNSAKRDRAPAEFYSEAQLRELAEILGLPYPELANPTPNLEVIRKITGNLDWFFDDFLANVSGMRFHEGKLESLQIVKAVQKVLNRCPEDEYIDVLAEYMRRI